MTSLEQVYLSRSDVQPSVVHCCSQTTWIGRMYSHIQKISAILTSCSWYKHIDYSLYEQALFYVPPTNMRMQSLAKEVKMWFWAFYFLNYWLSFWWAYLLCYSAIISYTKYLHITSMYPVTVIKSYHHTSAVVVGIVVVVVVGADVVVDCGVLREARAQNKQQRSATKLSEHCSAPSLLTTAAHEPYGHLSLLQPVGGRDHKEYFHVHLSFRWHSWSIAAHDFIEKSCSLPKLTICYLRPDLWELRTGRTQNLNVRLSTQNNKATTIKGSSLLLSSTPALKYLNVIVCIW